MGNKTVVVGVLFHAELNYTRPETNTTYIIYDESTRISIIEVHCKLHA